MVARASRCDRERLWQLLDGNLPDYAQTEIAAHVETCSDCQTQLESFAADQSDWSEMRIALSDMSGEVSNDFLMNADQAGSRSVPLGFLSPSDNPAMLGRIGEFEILDLIGCGGMGIVLKGYDHELNRYVAVKVLHPHCATSAAARRRFSREAQAAAAVVHQHVVAIHAVGANHHPPYLVMPFIPGESLQHRLNQFGPLDTVDTLRIGQQVAEGLAAAHMQGLVHRDIKPANILLERNVDRVLLTDFGLARAADDASLTQSGVIAGTPQFMSPEQARGDVVDHRTDLFSLGTVLYTLLAGHSPFRAETAMGVLRRVCEDTPRPLREWNPGVPAWLEAFIARLQAKHPADRFESASQVAELLKQCLAHLEQPTRVQLPDEIVRMTRENRRRSRAPIIAALSGIALVVGLASLRFAPAGGHPTTAIPAPAAGLSTDVLKWSDDHQREAVEIRSRIEQLEVEREDQF